MTIHSHKIVEVLKMREIDFNLKEHKGITGKLILTIPTYRQRLKMIKECNFKMNEKGEVNVGLETLDTLVKLLDLTKPHFKKVDLKCDDVCVKSFDEMESAPEFDNLLTAAASAILNAGKLGK